jgi:phosphatidylinositol glycan class B
MNLLKLSPKQIILLGFLVHLIAAWFSAGWHHPDEHYQLIEFAFSIDHPIPAASLPMEYAAQMRPSFQVWIIYAIIKICGFVGLNNPFMISFLMRWLIALLSMFAAIKLHEVIEFPNEKIKRIHLLLSVISWIAVYVHVRFSSETLSAIWFIFGLIPFLKPTNIKSLFIGGIFLGLSFITRFQSGFFIAGLVLYFLFTQKPKITSLISLILGFALSFGLGFYLDSLFYGNQVLTVWNYFDQNILHQVAASFGTEPFYWYFTTAFEKLIPPYSLILIVGFFLLVVQKRKDPITWSVWAFVLLHTVIGHKEFRFLFPLAFFVPYIILLGWDFLWNLSQEVNHKRFMRALDRFFFPINALVLLLIMLKPAHELAPLYEFIYDEIPAGSTLYFEKSDPYLSGNNEARFYLHGDLTRKQWNNDSTLQIVSPTYLLSEEWKQPAILRGMKAELKYSSIPEWIAAFNFNHWLERSNCYKVYELRPAENR